MSETILGDGSSQAFIDSYCAEKKYSRAVGHQLELVLVVGEILIVLHFTEHFVKDAKSERRSDKLEDYTCQVESMTAKRYNLHIEGMVCKVV